MAALADGDKLTRARSAGVSRRGVRTAQANRTLRPDQAAAFDYATGPGNLKLIEGRAGTGKSCTLAAIRDAHAADGMRVIGLAPTNAVAQDLAAGGFSESGTVHAALFALKNGRTSWNRDTVVVVDEAAMLDTPVTAELLAAARQAGAKLILAGDDRQLASIERGGLFSELRQRRGAVEITEVTRQSVDWQRQAARDLAEGRFAEAVGAFDRAGAITWTEKQDEARQALVAAWTRDTEEHPGASRFVFAYTNRDVDTLNAELRQVRRERGELSGDDVVFDTKHAKAAFAVGDRVQFTATDKKRHLYNGNAGTITGIDRLTGTITARLDAANGAGREVAWSAHEFEGFRHGYAGTIYKGQGKTLDRTYLYHTEHWRAAASYVALTRQRDSAQVFVARETARDATQLARQMGRGEVRGASVAWATGAEAAKLRAERQAEAAKAERKTERQAGQAAPAPPARKPGMFDRLDLNPAQSRPAAGRPAREPGIFDGLRLPAPARLVPEPVQPEAAPAAIERKTEGAKAGTDPDKEREEDSLRAKVRAATASAREKSNTPDEKSKAPLEPETGGVPAERQADPAAAYWKATANRPDKAQDGDRLRAKVEAALAERRRLDAANKQPEVPLVPDAQRQATVGSGPEDTATPAPLLPAWRDPTGQGRDSLGRGTSPEDLARVADKDPTVMREATARTRTLRDIYRDPDAAADALNALIKRSGNDLRAAAWTLVQDGPDSLGELRGREGWFAREAAKAERTYARSAAEDDPDRAGPASGGARGGNARLHRGGG